MTKRRYYRMKIPSAPTIGVVYGAFSDAAADAFAKSQGYERAGASYFAESVAVREVHLFHDRCMVSRQRRVT